MAATESAAGGVRRTRQQRQAAGRATATGLVRGELERQPRDPFSGNVPAVLAELGSAWGDLFEIAYDGCWWTASRKGAAGSPLREMSPDELIAAMRAAR